MHACTGDTKRCNMGKKKNSAQKNPYKVTNRCKKQINTCIYIHIHAYNKYIHTYIHIHAYTCIQCIHT